MSQETSEGLEGLRRAETQRRVLLLLIREEREMSNREVAEALKLSMNAVNIALHNLHTKGLVERVSRGVYRYKLGPILATILKRYLEGGSK
ncbi:winged helix-turn-helix transcriptional regulator [Candidatus Bathyarchaeota archaeon]|nr:winged helix-turn-helix transcriptional regulator [Candidatus Bathyarchaeota archaeon]